MSGGNGRGTMRPNNRSPPFLVVGLLVAMCILAFNYWNLSSKNRDLSSQLEGLQVDFRSVSDKHLTVEKRAADLNSQLAELQSRLNLIQNSASEKDSKVNNLNGMVESLNNQLQTAHQKTQEAQNEAQQVQQEKMSVSEELEKVKSQLTEEQKKTMVCDKSACRDVLRDVLKAMLDTVGKSAVTAALSPHHGDVLLMVTDLVQGAQEPQRQLNPQIPQFPPPGAGEGQQQQPGEQRGLPIAEQARPQLQAQDQNSDMGQNPNVGQAPNIVPDPNVVQMQQPRAPLDQAAVGQGGGITEKPQQQQPLNVLQQLPEVANSLDHHKPLPDMPQAQGGVADTKEEGKGGEQEIVAQNIPRREGEEVAVSNNNVNNHNVNELNAAPAQEDVGDDHHLDLPEDEMDKQAAANHGAGELGNLDDNLHNQLQDLSKNEVGEGDNEDKLEEQEGKEDIDLNGVDERRVEDDDYDEDNPKHMENRA